MDFTVELRSIFVCHFRPKFADEIKEPGSETETYCRSVSQVITVRQIVETRKFVTKFYSMKDDSLIGTTEFSDDGTATKSFTEEFSAPVVEVVPITSVSMVLEENESKGSWLNAIASYCN